MSFLLWLALLLGCAIAALLRRRRLALAAGVAAFALVAAVGTGLAPNLLRRTLAVDGSDTLPAWARANTIVMLGYGPVLPDRHGAPVLPAIGAARLVRTARTYRACRMVSADCQVILTGGDTGHRGWSEARGFGAVLADLGVPRADIRLETHSVDTWQNAVNSLPSIAPARTVTIVTSAYHLRRGLLYFRYLRPDVRGVAEPDTLGAGAPLDLATQFVWTDKLLHEAIRATQFALWARFVVKRGLPGGPAFDRRTAT